MKKTIKKRAFISAIAMLIVSAIVLTSSTFAWFSMAKKVEVSSMDLAITSPEGVQISANTDAWTTALTKEDFTGESGSRFAAKINSGSVAQPDGLTTAQGNHFPELLKPSSSAFTNAAKLPSFFEGSIGENGRATAYAVTDASGAYVVFDLFVQLGASQNVYWGESSVVCNDNPDVESAMRIALVNCGNGDKTTATSVLPRNLPDAAVMYETDANNHTDASGVADGTYVATKYATQAFTDAMTAGANKNYVDVFQVQAPSCKIAKDTDALNANTRFAGVAGVNRVRVYVWMEGNDVDCANDVAGAAIQLNLVLTID